MLIGALVQVWAAPMNKGITELEVSVRDASAATAHVEERVARVEVLLAEVEAPDGNGRATQQET